MWRPSDLVAAIRALRPARITPVHWAIIVLSIPVLVLAAALYVFRGAIFETLIDPGIPYQMYAPPPAPNYADPKAWAVIPAKPATWTSADPPADIFFIHPTTYAGRSQWNARIDNRNATRLLSRVVIPNYAGPFTSVGRVFAPRYRQASLYSMMTLREDAREARAFAYRDIAEAFEHYMRDYNGGRPIIVVGVEQGGVLADRLVRDHIAANPDRLKRLAAAYLIETAVPPDKAPLTACTGPGDYRCTVAYLSEAFNETDRTRDRLRHAGVWDGRAIRAGDVPTPLCVNPLLGKASDEAAPRKLNKGAANATSLEWGVKPGFLSGQVGAQCVDGVLKVTRARSPSLRKSGGWFERQRVRGYNFFYADLEADAQARVDGLFRSGEVDRMAPPLEQVVEIGETPVHQVK